MKKCKVRAVSDNGILGNHGLLPQHFWSLLCARNCSLLEIEWTKLRPVLILMEITFLVAQLVKHLPAMREIWVQFLGRAVPLEKEMAPHSSILAWRIPWTAEPDGLQSIVSQE